MDELFHPWNREIGRFQEFLRQIRPPTLISDSILKRLHQSHPGVRPAELFAQKRLAQYPIHPGFSCEAVRDFGPDLPLVALLSYISLAPQSDRDQDLLAAEFIMLEHPSSRFPELASRFIRDHLATGSPGTLLAFTPAVVSLINLLAVSAFGDPTDELLDDVAVWFAAYLDSRTGERNPAAIAVGSLLWRALDARRIEHTVMYDFVHTEPDLLRILESDLLYAGTRVSAAVPPGSPSERLIEQVCLERLAALGTGRSASTWGGPIKSISLWPGADVLLAALDHCERVGQLSRDELRDSQASDLWHVLRHSRPATGTPIDHSDLQRFSTRILVQAAMVAPWYATDFEGALGFQGLDDIVTWAHAHARSVMAGSDPSPELPRVKRQVAVLIEDRGLISAGERDEGVVERDWLVAAVDRLGPQNTALVLRAIHLAYRHRTYLAEAIEAVLGRNGNEIWTAARERRLLFVRMLGLLPLSASDPSDRLHWLAGFAADAAKSSASKRLMEHDAAVTAATNLAWADGVANGMLLAWHHNHPGVGGEGIEVPVEFERHRVRLGADSVGDPTLEVVKRGRPDRPLKGVPREIAADPDFQSMRKAIRDLDGFLSRFRATCERRLLMGYELRPATVRLLLEHPVIGRMVKTCVFTDGETDGLPVLDGKAVRLEDEDGDLHAVRRNANLMMVHPLDLRDEATLEAWRDELVKRRWTQPVPQLFRAIPQPRVDSAAQISAEYADREIAVAPAVDLLRAGGWMVGAGQHPRRYYPDSELIACWPFGDRAANDLLNRSLGITGPLSFVDAETHEALALADVPDSVLSDAARDCVRVIAAFGSDDQMPPAVVDSRYAFMRRIVAREQAGEDADSVEPRLATEVTRESLELRIPAPLDAGAIREVERSENAGALAPAEGEPFTPLPVAHARIDLMTGELLIGDNREGLELSIFDDPAPSGFFPHPPDPTLDRLVRTWLGVRNGVKAGNAELYAACTDR